MLVVKVLRFNHVSTNLQSNAVMLTTTNIIVHYGLVLPLENNMETSTLKTFHMYVHPSKIVSFKQYAPFLDFSRQTNLW